mgnify:CR=1 FL=1
MPNNHIFKNLIIVVISSGLFACQSGPQPQATAPPEPQIETKIEPAAQQQVAVEDLLYQQAIQSTRDGDIDKAIQQFTKVIQKDPSTKQAYTNLGLLYIHKKQNEEAKAAFLNAIKQDKNDAIAYNHLAVLQRQQGEFKLALFNYYKAINAKPDYANAHLNLGILLDIYLQDLPKALEQYEIYQKLTDHKNESVEKWILDMKRRIETDSGNSK